VLGLLILLAIGGAIFWSGVVAYTAWGLTHPPRRTTAWAISKGAPSDPSELDEPRDFDEWSVSSRGLELAVWDVRGDADEPGAPTVIVTHGWADSRLGALPRMQFLAPHARRVLAWDQEGHGETRGVCRLGTAEPRDLQAIIDRVGDDGSPIVLYGWSLGAGASIAAASGAGERVAGVIAEAPYRTPLTPARNVLRNASLPYRLNLAPAMGLVGMIFGVGPAWRGFDRREHAARLACPLVVIHGTDDQVSPIEDGREIAHAASQGAIVEIKGAGHNDIWAEEEFAMVAAEAVERMLRRVRSESCVS